MSTHSGRPRALLIGAVLFAAVVVLAEAPPARAGQYYTATLLPMLGGTATQGYGINDRGQITGRSYIAGNAAVHAFLYSGGAMTDLGTLGGTNSEGRGINNAGQVTGWAQRRGSEAHAFLYSAGAMSDLGTLGGAYGAGYAINDRGQVGGSSYTSANVSFHAFVYSDGAMVDLNSVVVSGLGGATLTEARGINDDGQIIANACSDPYPDPEPTFSCTAFLLDPVVEEVTQIPTLSGSALVAMAVLLLTGGILRVGDASNSSWARLSCCLTLFCFRLPHQGSYSSPC